MASFRVVEIARQDLQGLSSPSSRRTTITKVKHLSSYNWIGAPAPVIAVPGTPAFWAPPQLPQGLKQDTGLVYIAQNAARLPDSPMEPLFRAVQITQPSFNFKAIDVVTDRNNIRKLLSFVNPSLGSKGREAFTIAIEVVGDTAIFCRQETKTYAIIQEHEFQGYGHAFEEKFTSNRIPGSTGHHRIINYRFGGLKFVVRHETDASLDMTPDLADGGLDDEHKDSRDLRSMFAKMKVSRALVPPAAPAAVRSKLFIRQQGHEVPLWATLEIKTRAMHKQIGLQEVAPQLWVSQTPKLVRAYHTKGWFHVPQVEDVSNDVAKWEQSHKADLVKLAALVERIISVAKELGGNVVVKYGKASDKLVISAFAGKKMLPEDLYSLWAEKTASGDGWESALQSANAGADADDDAESSTETDSSTDSDSSWAQSW